MENKDIIAMARELGKALQEEEAYVRYMAAKQAADEDEELQRAIEKFSSTRDAISAETLKDENERDTEKLKALSEDMRKAYAGVMTNERMIGYNDAKDEFDVIFRRIIAIIQKSGEGEDPVDPKHFSAVRIFPLPPSGQYGEGEGKENGDGGHSTITSSSERFGTK